MRVRFNELRRASQFFPKILKGWWVMRDLNPRHLRCERSARRAGHCYPSGYAVRIGGTGAERAAGAGSFRFGEPGSTLYGDLMAPCLRRAAPIASFRICARFVADSGAFRDVSARVSLGYAKKPRMIGGAA